MKLLILGGTRFLGIALAEAALAAGHEVALFNRGRHPPIPGTESLQGDRGGDLGALRGRRWDAVIDTSGYLPQHVRASAGLLADAAEHYTFISSISVYTDFSQPGLREDSPVRTPPIEEPAELNLELYGELKVACERAAENAMPGRVLVLRPGLIVGPHDYMGRFPYCCRRIAQGGEVLAPGDPDREVQLVDARDLAQWNLRMAETRGTGIFNVTGPASRLAMGEMLEAIPDAAGSDARFNWVPGEFLREQGVEPWEEMPFWVPPELAGILSADVSRAVAAGLRFRPLRETAGDTLAWLQSGSAPGPPYRAGLAPEREETVLRAWRDRVTPSAG